MPFNVSIDFVVIFKKSLKKILKFNQRIPKNCVLCERWILFKAPICKSCRHFLYSEYKKYELEFLNIDGHRCVFLWKWTSRNHEWIQKIVLAMKNGDHYELYKVFMPWLIKKSGYIDPCSSVIAIPSQSRKHPESLTKVFLSILPDHSVIEFKKLKSESQKFKSKNQRKDIKFILKNKPSVQISKLTKTPILILDDVLATGGSFKAMLLCLKDSRVQFIAVWAYKDIGSNEDYKNGTLSLQECYSHKEPDKISEFQFL